MQGAEIFPSIRGLNLKAPTPSEPLRSCNPPRTSNSQSCSAAMAAYPLRLCPRGAALLLCLLLAALHAGQASAAPSGVLPCNATVSGALALNLGDRLGAAVEGAFAQCGGATSCDTLAFDAALVSPRWAAGGRLLAFQQPAGCMHGACLLMRPVSSCLLRRLWQRRWVPR